MSFSSTSTSTFSLSDDSSTLSSPPPPPHPDYKKLELLLLSLIALARRTYSSLSHNERRRAVTEYVHLQPRLARFFAKHERHDYVADGTYGYCLEMSKLVRLIESGLPITHRNIEALDLILGAGPREMRAEERARLDQKVSMDVELLIFGSMDLDCEKLPWNGKSKEPTGADVLHVGGY